MTPGEIERFPMTLESIFSDFEMSVMEDIVRRIVINGEITPSADWQLVRLLQLGQSRDYIRKTLEITLGKAKLDVNELFTTAEEQEYIRDKTLYEATSKEFIPYEKNNQLKQAIDAISEQTKQEFTNITQSLGFSKVENGKAEFVDLTKYYQETLDKAMLQISTGTFSKEQVVKQVVKEMTNSGLRTIDYDSGYNSRINVAVRRALNTGLGQLTAKVNEFNAEKLETNDYEVSWHGTARPEHQIWQGRVFPYEELISICGLGTVTGLCGANCRHSYRPFIVGISVRTYTDEQLDEMNKAENKPKEYNGKEYSKYEATQRMRQLETRMRAQRQRIKLLKDANSLEDVTAERAKYKETMRQYKDFAEKMDLPQQKQRIYDDGLGKV